MKQLLRKLSAVASICTAITASAQTTDQTQVPTLHVKAQIVTIDMVVTDDKGQPVHDLKASDFTILDAGKPQTIRNFEEHRAQTTVQVAKDPAMADPHYVTNAIPIPEDGPLNVLVIDTIFMSPDSRARLRSDMIEFLEKLPPGRPFVIFSTGTQLSMIQSFSDNPQALASAIKANNATYNIFKPGNGASSAGNTAYSMDSAGYSDPDQNAAMRSMNGDKGAAISQFLQDATSTVLRSNIIEDSRQLRELGRYLSGFPGRKNLMWLTEGWPLSSIPNLGGDSFSANNQFASRFSNQLDNYDAVEKLSRIFAQSEVTVYPISTTMLTTLDVHQASYSPAPGAIQGGSVRAHTLEKDAAATSERENRFTVNLVAGITGGKVYANTNDLRKATQSAYETGANYYTITYIPGESLDPKVYHSIKVKTTQKLHLAYRTGYFPEDTSRKTTSSSTPGTTPEINVVEAMKHNYLAATDILFKAKVDKVTQRPSSESTGSAKTNYLVYYAVDPSNIDWTEQDNIRSATLNLMLIAYDKSGKVVESSEKMVDYQLMPAELAAAQKNGLSIRQTISLLARPDLYLRLGVLQKDTNKIGSAEIRLDDLDKPSSSTKAN